MKPLKACCCWINVASSSSSVISESMSDSRGWSILSVLLNDTPAPVPLFLDLLRTGVLAIEISRNYKYFFKNQ